MREKEIEKLANDLEEPRAVRLLAEWLAIEHDKTRLQGDEYMEAAQELYDYLLTIGFRLIPLVREEIKKELLTDEEIDTAYVDGWASRNAEVDDLLELKAVDGDEEIDVLRELAQAQIQKIIKRMEEK